MSPSSSHQQPLLLPAVVQSRALVVVLVAAAVLFNDQAAANSIVLEGNDGQVQFGDTGSDPTIERVPNADAGAADHLAIRGAGGLVVEGPISASLLDLNSTGGSLWANEITVNTLTVNGAAASSPQAGGSSTCQQAELAHISLYTASLQYNQFAATPGITGSTTWYRSWSAYPELTYDPDGIFSVYNNQQVTVAKNGTYLMTLEHFMSPTNIYGGSDSRYVVIKLARDGAQLSGAYASHCLVLGAREKDATSCRVFLKAGTVVGLGGYGGGATDSTAFMYGGAGAYPTWTIALESERV